MQMDETLKRGKKAILMLTYVCCHPYCFLYLDGHMHSCALLVNQPELALSHCSQHSSVVSHTLEVPCTTDLSWVVDLLLALSLRKNDLLSATSDMHRKSDLLKIHTSVLIVSNLNLSVAPRIDPNPFELPWSSRNPNG